jgi:hypothetical protein
MIIGDVVVVGLCWSIKSKTKHMSYSNYCCRKHFVVVVSFPHRMQRRSHIIILSHRRVSQGPMNTIVEGHYKKCIIRTLFTAAPLFSPLIIIGRLPVVAQLCSVYFTRSGTVISKRKTSQLPELPTKVTYIDTF